MGFVVSGKISDLQRDVNQKVCQPGNCCNMQYVSCISACLLQKPNTNRKCNLLPICLPGLHYMIYYIRLRFCSLCTISQFCLRCPSYYLSSLPLLVSSYVYIVILFRAILGFGKPAIRNVFNRLHFCSVDLVL